MIPNIMRPTGLLLTLLALIGLSLIAVGMAMIEGCTPLEEAQRTCRTGYTYYAHDPDCVSKQLEEERAEGIRNAELAAHTNWGGPSVVVNQGLVIPR